MTLDLDRLAEIAAEYTRATQAYMDANIVCGRYTRGSHEWLVLQLHGEAQHAFQEAFTPEAAAALIAELRAAREVVAAARMSLWDERTQMHHALAAYDQAANAKETTT